MYIAAKWKPELIGKTPQEKARVYQMLTLVNDNFVDKIIMPNVKSADQMANYETAKAAFTPIVERLSSQNFICGDKVTVPDFMLFEAINFLNILGSPQGMSDSSKVFQDFPYLLAYQKRMSSLPGLKEYLASSKHIEHPFFPPFFQCKLKKADGTLEHPQ